MPKPHDLVRFAPPALRRDDGPDWLASALNAAPWAVVRRARCEPGLVPVGIRGVGRAQRHATVIDAGAIAELLSPSDLVDRVGRLPGLPAAQALRDAAAILEPTGLRWGPGGSVGFTLATGVMVMTNDSDLDLVVTTDRVPPQHVLTTLSTALRRLPARVDCQIDLPAGGVALAELVGADRVMVRTADGPVLVDTTELAA